MTTPSLQTLRLEWSKWADTAKINASKQLAYKTSFILQLISPTLIFFAVKYNIWASIYDMPGTTTIQGYDRGTMLQYQAWVMIVAFLGQGFLSTNMAQDIRLGRISTYLIYPFDFWKFEVAGYIGFLGVQVAVATLTLAALRLSGVFPALDPLTLLQGVSYTLVVGFLWFAVQYNLALVAFWLDETWVLRVIFIMAANFLSGAILPLEMFPASLQQVIAWSPFPYMTHVPVKILMGTYDGSLLQAWGVMVGWIIVVAAMAAFFWRRGMKHYTAAGM